jgi:DNA-binding YbaB/EbfC family protein
MKDGLENLMRQAQRMQEDMQRAQAEIASLECVGEAGAGLVRVVVNGRHDVKSVTLAAELQGEDLSLVADLLAAAVNDANRKLDKLSKDKMAGLTAGLNLPPGMKFPF